MGRVRSGVGLGSAIFGVMTSFPASKAPSLSHALSVLLGGKFLESNGIDFHGIRVGGGEG